MPFLVRLDHGPDWDPAKRRREQAGWEEHAAFMDALVEDRFISLGGPVGEGDGEDVLLVVESSGEEEIRTRLAADPWWGTILVLTEVRPWNVLLRGGTA
jgi:uncharacterized protein YciI